MRQEVSRTDQMVPEAECEFEKHGVQVLADGPSWLGYGEDEGGSAAQVSVRFGSDGCSEDGCFASSQSASEMMGCHCHACDYVGVNLVKCQVDMFTDAS